MESTMSPREDELRIRPGRIRDRGRGSARPKTFVGEVMRAARKAGHTGNGFGREKRGSGSSFGRGEGWIKADAESTLSCRRRHLLGSLRRHVRPRGMQLTAARQSESTC